MSQVASRKKELIERIIDTRRNFPLIFRKYRRYIQKTFFAKTREILWIVM